MADQTRMTNSCPAQLTNFCAQRHWAIYWIILICALIPLVGRVMQVGADGKLPFNSANDRSRWCTVASLGEFGTYEIDRVIQAHPDWDTIDKVQHVGTDDQLHFYSSKPTLFPTLLAGLYCGIRSVTGWNIFDDTTSIVRLMLLSVNVIPFGLLLYCLAHLIDRVAVRDWTRYFVLACAGLGTFLSTFGITLNNHLPAAVCVMIALNALFWIWKKDFEGNRHPVSWYWYAMAGGFSALAAANELPALAFLCIAAGLCLLKSIPKFAVAFVPSAAMVVVAFFYANFVAHGEWRPAYAHRSDGRVLEEFEGDYDSMLNAGQLPVSFRDGQSILRNMQVPTVSSRPNRTGRNPEQPRWVVRDMVGVAQVAIVNDGSAYKVREWNHWYDYPNSYWFSDRRSEVDQGQPDQLTYLFHVLFGHHGIFSLTPIWILAMPGLFALVFSSRLNLRWCGLAGILLTLVVTAFYVTRPEIDRNYGGFASGLRWLFWLVPVWLLGLLPVADWLGRTVWGRWLCYLLFAVSGISAAYAWSNPWVHPWLYEIWDVTGLPR